MRLIAKGAGVFSALLVAGWAQAELEGTDSYGVYIKAQDEYVATQQIDAFSRLNFDPTSRMFDFPVIDRGDSEGVELVVHHPDFHPGPFQAEARPIDTPGERKPLEVSITPQDNDKYVIETDESVPDDHLIMVSLGCCIDGVNGAALTEPKPVVTEAFAEGSEGNPAAVEQKLATMAEALPDDDEIAALHDHWQTRVAQEEATEHFEFIQGVWEEYENAEETEERITQLQRIENVTQNYLDDHPEGREREEVKEMQEEAQEKLDI